MSGVSTQESPLLVLCSVEQALCGVYYQRIPPRDLKSALFFFSESKAEYIDFTVYREWSGGNGCSHHLAGLLKANRRAYDRPLGSALSRLKDAVREAGHRRLEWRYDEDPERKLSYIQLDLLLQRYGLLDVTFDYQQPFSVDTVEQELERQGRPCRVYRPCHSAE